MRTYASLTVRSAPNTSASESVTAWMKKYSGRLPMLIRYRYSFFSSRIRRNASVTRGSWYSDVCSLMPGVGVGVGGVVDPRTVSLSARSMAA